MMDIFEEMKKTLLNAQDWSTTAATATCRAGWGAHCSTLCKMWLDNSA